MEFLIFFKKWEKPFRNWESWNYLLIQQI